MKAGCFAALCAAFHLAALDRNTHLFVPQPLSDLGQSPTDTPALPTSFPGRIFRITAVTTLGKRDLRKALAGITHANIAVRNFPLTADALRARLRLRDGGDIYIFATTISSRHLLLITEKS